MEDDCTQIAVFLGLLCAEPGKRNEANAHAMVGHLVVSEEDGMDRVARKCGDAVLPVRFTVAPCLSIYRDLLTLALT